MPINKDFKKLVRARMSKTGESYTAARAQLLRKPALRAASAPLAAAPEAQSPSASWTTQSSPA
jgi:hypothetical protein